MTIIVKQVNWYLSQISDERLHDHWSSSFSFITYRVNVCMEKNSLSPCSNPFRHVPLANVCRYVICESE